jgi:hypothetical protein
VVSRLLLRRTGPSSCLSTPVFLPSCQSVERGKSVRRFFLTPLTKEHGTSTSFIVPSDADEPKSAVVRERVDTLLAEVELLPASRRTSSVTSTSLGVQALTLVHAFIARISSSVHRISATEKPGETRKTAEQDEVSVLPFSCDLPQPPRFLMHAPRLLRVILVRLAAAAAVLDACSPPSARHTDAMCRSYVTSVHLCSIRTLPPPARACHPTMPPRLSGAHINPAVERTRTDRDHVALLPARARCHRGLRVRAPGRARPRAEPAPRARVGRAADECASCHRAARERRLTRDGRLRGTSTRS